MVTPKKIAAISPTRVICTRIFYSIILIFPAIGCNTAPISNTPSLENGSDTTPRVSPTMIPVMPTFRDDFSGQLNPDWKWQNEDASHYKVNEDGWLEITGGSENILADEQQTNLLWTSLPEGDFVISIHLKSQPLFDFQQAGILLSDDSGQYVSLSRGYCMQCVLGGSGVFLVYNLEGNRVRYASATDATDLYLMLIRVGGVISGFYATEAGQWRQVASLRNGSRFYHVGLSVTNDSTWNEGLDVIGIFDFFEIRPSFHQKPTPIPGSYQQG